MKTENKPKPEVGKGSFHNRQRQDDESEGEDSRKKRSNKRKHSTGEKSDDKPKCKACRLPFHSLERCYYVFPELAPDSFKPYDRIQEQTDKALKEDEKLKKEVKELRRQKKTKKEDSAGSTDDPKQKEHSPERS
jgi:hypothetical protein